MFEKGGKNMNTEFKIFAVNESNEKGEFIGRTDNYKSALEYVQKQNFDCILQYADCFDYIHIDEIETLLNRERVKVSREKVDRITIYLPKNTSTRIENLGFKKTAFCRNAVLQELEKLEKLKK